MGLFWPGDTIFMKLKMPKAYFIALFGFDVQDKTEILLLSDNPRCNKSWIDYYAE